MRDAKVVWKRMPKLIRSLRIASYRSVVMLDGMPSGTLCVGYQNLPIDHRKYFVRHINFRRLNFS